MARTRHWFRHRRTNRRGTAVSPWREACSGFGAPHVAGGFTHSFYRPRYEWDVGLHYNGQVQDGHSAVRREFDHITDVAARWSAMPEMYDRAVIDGRIFNFTAGIERFREGMSPHLFDNPDTFMTENTALDGRRKISF